MKLSTKFKIFKKTIQLMAELDLSPSVAKQAAIEWFKYNAACKKFTNTTDKSSNCQMCKRDDGAMIIYSWSSEDYDSKE